MFEWTEERTSEPPEESQAFFLRGLLRLVVGEGGVWVGEWSEVKW